MQSTNSTAMAEVDVSGGDPEKGRGGREAVEKSGGKEKRGGKKRGEPSMRRGRGE